MDIMKLSLATKNDIKPHLAILKGAHNILSTKARLPKYAVYDTILGGILCEMYKQVWKIYRPK